MKSWICAILIACCAVVSLQAATLEQAKRSPKQQALMAEKAKVSDLKADVIYKTIDGIDLTLDIMLPKVTEKNGKPLFPNGTPVVFYLHGGGWHAGHRNMPLRDVDFFSKNGIALVGVSYRFANKGERTIADCVTDCFDAVRFIAKEADKYGLDTNAFLAYGHSAGGHLTMMVVFADPAAFPGDPALADASFKFVGGVPMAPPTTFIHPEGWTPRSWALVERNYMDAFGGTMDERKDIAAKVSPITWITKDSPRVVIIHGNQDPVIPFAQATIIKEKADAIGLEMTLLEIPNGDHGYRGKHTVADRALCDEIAWFNLLQMAREQTAPAKPEAASSN